ncbi:MAG: hypothetical protein KAG14_00465, partial [Mycoplasmataceae bacterium]|nr:hypothetical protein [Mycoplasmataceae bacterium]
MKKIILGLGTIATIVVPVVAVVSCGKEKGDSKNSIINREIKDEEKIIVRSSLTLYQLNLLYRKSNNAGTLGITIPTTAPGTTMKLGLLTHTKSGAEVAYSLISTSRTEKTPTSYGALTIVPAESKTFKDITTTSLVTRTSSKLVSTGHAAAEVTSEKILESLSLPGYTISFKSGQDVEKGATASYLFTATQILSSSPFSDRISFKVSVTATQETFIDNAKDATLKAESSLTLAELHELHQTGNNAGTLGITLPTTLSHGETITLGDLSFDGSIVTVKYTLSPPTNSRIKISEGVLTIQPTIEKGPHDVRVSTLIAKVDSTFTSTGIAADVTTD